MFLKFSLDILILSNLSEIARTTYLFRLSGEQKLKGNGETFYRHFFNFIPMGFKVQEDIIIQAK